ncbi:plasma-membrane choline transporter-domain-containing protein [Pilaira anomala]|nr:plasma-membrane choline transporter-domain-containing protein [Pilaira anomala]
MYNPEDQQKYYPPPPNGQYNTQITPEQGNYTAPPPAFQDNNPQTLKPYTEGPDHIQPASGWNDVWATILWLCNVGAFIGLAVVGLRTFQGNQNSYSSVPSQNQYSGLTFDTTTFKIFGFSAIVGFGLSFLYLIFANIPLIIVTFIGSIIVYFGVTIYYFVMHYYSAAIVFLIFACLYAACFFWWRSRIPFATIIGIYQAWYSSASNNSKLNCAMVFLVFSFYWTSQVITYVTHVTLAGIFATVYFLNDGIQHPVWGSAKRALTTSFGSICFGALVIAIINVIRYFLQVARSNTDNAAFAFLICIIQCIVNCAAGLFEWFNYYAFSGVAIYGKPFVPTARKTWTMVKDRGIEAMINDNLIGNVLFMGGLLVGVLCGLLGYIYLKASQPVYNQDGGMTPVVVMMCFLIGSSMFSTIATVISSGVATTFVCLAEDPEALRRSKPELFEKIRETWPRIAQGV